MSILGGPQKGDGPFGPPLKPQKQIGWFRRAIHRFPDRSSRCWRAPRLSAGLAPAPPPRCPARCPAPTAEARGVDHEDQRDHGASVALSGLVGVCSVLCACGSVRCTCARAVLWHLCGVVWCFVVWRFCGVVWCGVVLVWCGVVRRLCAVVWRDVVWCGVGCCGVCCCVRCCVVAWCGGDGVAEVVWQRWCGGAAVAVMVWFGAV